MKTLTGKLSPANVLAFIAAIVAIAGAVTLTALHDPAPALLWAIAVAGVTAGAGLSIPAGSPSSTLADLTAVLPQLVAALPGAVKVEDVAAEILRQVAAAAPAAAATSSTPAAP